MDDKQLIANLVKCVDGLMPGIGNIVFDDIALLNDTLIAARARLTDPPPRPIRYFLEFTQLETSTVEKSMLITAEDAKRLASMHKDEQSDWIMGVEPDYSKGLYDVMSGKEYVEDSDPPENIRIVEDRPMEVTKHADILGPAIPEN